VSVTQAVKIDWWLTGNNAMSKQYQCLIWRAAWSWHARLYCKWTAYHGILTTVDWQPIIDNRIMTTVYWQPFIDNHILTTVYWKPYIDNRILTIVYWQPFMDNRLLSTILYTVYTQYSFIAVAKSKVKTFTINK